MPHMDGLELCRAIRDGSHYPGYVYIMLCTAHDSEEEILAGLNSQQLLCRCYTHLRMVRALYRYGQGGQP